MAALAHSEFGAILRTLEAALAQRPDQSAWCNLSLIVSRSAPA
jgi:hypothetical protein